MRWLRFLRRGQWDDERARELASYIEQETADNVARGGSGSAGYLRDKTVQRAVAVAQRELGARGRVLLRASGTEPVIRVMVEGEARTVVKRCARAIAQAVQRVSS